MKKVLVHNIGLLCTPVGSHVHAGAQQAEIQSIPQACVLAEDGVITYCGPASGLRF